MKFLSRKAQIIFVWFTTSGNSKKSYYIVYNIKKSSTTIFKHWQDRFDLSDKYLSKHNDQNVHSCQITQITSSGLTACLERFWANLSANQILSTIHSLSRCYRPSCSFQQTHVCTISLNQRLAASETYCENNDCFVPPLTKTLSL